MQSDKISAGPSWHLMGFFPVLIEAVILRSTYLGRYPVLYGSMSLDFMVTPASICASSRKYQTLIHIIPQ